MGKKTDHSGHGVRDTRRRYPPGGNYSFLSSDFFHNSIVTNSHFRKSFNMLFFVISYLLASFPLNTNSTEMYAKLANLRVITSNCSYHQSSTLFLKKY